MKFSVLLGSALHSLKGNARRTILTMLGIIIGIAAVITIMSLGKGFQWIVQEGLSIGDKVIANPDSDITDGAAVSSTQLEESVKSHD